MDFLLWKLWCGKILGPLIWVKVERRIKWQVCQSKTLSLYLWLLILTERSVFFFRGSSQGGLMFFWKFWQNVHVLIEAKTTDPAESSPLWCFEAFFFCHFLHRQTFLQWGFFFSFFWKNSDMLEGKCMHGCKQSRNIQREHQSKRRETLMLPTASRWRPDKMCTESR